MEESSVYSYKQKQPVSIFLQKRKTTAYPLSNQNAHTDHAETLCQKREKKEKIMLKPVCVPGIRRHNYICTCSVTLSHVRIRSVYYPLTMVH
jgi:hypothetical protein